MKAGIVVVGDEILSGHVRDANSHFIAVRLADLGHQLCRVQVVGDDPKEIERAIGVELGDVTDIVFVCGGLGPTHDDRTMEGVAAALGLPLERCGPIAELIEQIAGKVRDAAFAGDPLGVEGLMKMAMAPAGAEALICRSGIIPAATVVAGATRICILPGPPRELEMVFRDAVEPQFLEGTGAAVWREEVEHFFPESALAAALVSLEAAFPGVKIGSYPLEDRCLIRIAGIEADAREVASRVRSAVETLAASDDGQRLLDFMHGRRHRSD
jgi:molybdenum cofactor synthesis domain-containing protein